MSSAAATTKGPEKVGLPRRGTGGSRMASPRPAGSATHRARRGAARAPEGSPEKSSRGRGERARRPPGSSVEARARLSALSGQPGPPRPAPGRCPPGRAGTVGRADAASAASAAPRSRRLSYGQARPGLAGLAPRRRGHLVLPQDPPGARGATPPKSRPASRAAAALSGAPHRPLAPLGLPGNRGSSATPGGPPAERAHRAADATRPPARGAAGCPARLGGRRDAAADGLGARASPAVSLSRAGGVRADPQTALGERERSFHNLCPNQQNFFLLQFSDDFYLAISSLP